MLWYTRHEHVPVTSYVDHNRGYAVGVASRLATVIYVAMVMTILYDNSYSPNSDLKYESYRLYGWFLKIVKLWP